MLVHNTLAAASPRVSARHEWIRAISWGTLIAGSADIVAGVLPWVLKGVPLQRVLQGIAGGLLGREAFSGGVWTAALGVLLHFFIMSVIVTVFFAAARKLPALKRHWLASGVAYGIAVYVVMTFIVVPLSAAMAGSPSLATIVQGVLVHIGCVGVPIAYITQRFGGTASSA